KLAAALTEMEGLKLALDGELRLRADELKAAQAARDATARDLAAARDATRAGQVLLDKTRGDMAALEKRAGAAARDLADARAALADADLVLKKRQGEIDALAKKDAAGAAQLDALQRLMRAKDEDRVALEARLAATRKGLADAEAKLLATRRDLDAQLAAAQAAAKAATEELAAATAAAKVAAEALAATRAGAAKTGDELGTARAQVKDLARKIDDANATIIDLQGDKAKLADRYDKLQRDSEARFAGVAMTGKRVLFLVDMSGSMGKRDLQTPDPTKWPLVIETVCKVMRSIPTLESYQVIVFSSAARWLFGAGEWQAFDGERSVGRVSAALLKVKPVDDTNMYAAFEKAFGLRAAGLDTLYLFSDGLPTSGPGLTAAQQSANPPLSETDTGIILGKHVRDTMGRTWNRTVAGQPRVRVNAVGFFFDSVEVGAFLWALARDNDGSFVGMSKP
ncbi:MAG: vWA domain-containing protein, partial [Gemmata sp.]